MGDNEFLGQANDRCNVGERSGRYLGHADFCTRYLLPFSKVEHFYDEEKGFIVWRMGTGENAELLHIRSFCSGKGFGRALVYAMLDSLRDSPPYYSVFGFTRVGNDNAAKFYGALGFNLLPITGLYKDGAAIMFWQCYEKLLADRLTRSPA